MNWLIWKEYRLNRAILIFAALVVLAPHVVALVSAWYNEWPAAKVLYSLVGSGFFGLAFGQVVLALLGGYAFAGERQDRSAEFLAYLPVPKAKTVAGKAILAVAVTAGIWAVNGAVMLFAFNRLPHVTTPDINPENAGMMLGNVAVTGLAFFAIGWLLSAFVSSPGFAVLVSLGTTWLTAMAVAWLAFEFLGDKASGDVVTQWYRGTCLVLSGICLVAGTWYYLRRVEP